MRIIIWILDMKSIDNNRSWSNIILSSPLRDDKNDRSPIDAHCNLHTMAARVSNLGFRPRRSRFEFGRDIVHLVEQIQSASGKNCFLLAASPTRVADDPIDRTGASRCVSRSRLRSKLCQPVPCCPLIAIWICCNNSPLVSRPILHVWITSPQSRALVVTLINCVETRFSTIFDQR